MSLSSRCLTAAIRSLLAAAALVALLAAQLLSATTAFAHDALISSAPADGAQVARSPAVVTLTFNGPVITQFAQLTVTGPDGAGRQSGTPEVSGTTVTQPLTEQGPAGTYEVAWRVVSADGHPISGVFSYVVTTGPTTAVPPSPTAPTSTATAQAPRQTVVSASPAAAVSTAGSTNWVPIATVLVVLLVALGVAAAVVSRRRGARGGGG